MTKQELLDTIWEAEENRDKLIRSAAQYETIISELYQQLGLYKELQRYDLTGIKSGSK